MYLTRWIETHARIRPSKIAIVDRTRQTQLTYRELYRAALAQAARLQALGVEPGDRVALFSNNRHEVLEVFFGCAFLGAALVPLNVRLNRGELEKILEDCSPRLLLVEAGLEDQAPAHPQAFPLTTAAAGEPQGRPAADPRAPVAILYTGGTTGTPKGAILTHESIQWNAWNTISGWGLCSDDIAPVFTPMFHTGGLNVLATPLFCLGGTVVLPGPFDPELALSIIEQERCTLVFMVPTMYEMLRQAQGFAGSRFSAVRQLISGGAPCPEPLFQAYWELGLPLRQGYGLTEAGPNNFGVNPEEARKRPGTVGVPLPNVQIRLVREDGREADHGEVGELVVAGGHVMPGYWGRPHETGQVLQDGWLRTGDLARRDVDGYYYICGRSKEMFISGGENVFPAEVEGVLLSHPDVAEAAVVGVPHPKWGEIGRAYLVPTAGRNLDPDEMLEYCRLRLGRYKVPKEVVVRDSLPKSAAGKVLKRLLVNH
ncbi:MAG: AMP-binding protein [Armatimonadetes bacterium]|nr:AMP-binding protein [Armatimonadota bacterium]